VDSAIVEIIPRPAPFTVRDENLFFRVTEATFNHRRKKIGTSLRAAGMIEGGWEIPFADSRVEDLRPVEIAEIADSIFMQTEHKDL